MRYCDAWRSKLAELVADVRARIGMLSVRCSVDVADATIEIGEHTKLTGCATAPKIVRFSVPARRESIEVRLVSPTFQAAPARVVVEGGAPPGDILLSALARSTSGRLVVRVTPRDATIAVDGVDRGNPPLEVALAAGAHTVDVRADRHEPARLAVVVDAGRTKDMSVDLVRSAPVTSRWWFWTAVGVGVAAVATTTVLLVVQPEKDGHSGSGFSPPRTTVSFVRF